MNFQEGMIAWLLLAAGSLLLLPAGYLCLDAGLSSRRHGRQISFKYPLGVAIALLSFLLLGYSLMYGRSNSGWFGSPDLAGAWRTADMPGALQRLFQALYTTTAVAAALLAAPRRLRPAAYVWLALLLATCLFPIINHWVYQPAGWLNRLGFIDNGGSSSIQALAGWSALALAMLAERHSGRSRPAAARSLPWVGLGIFLVWLGWLGLHLSRLTVPGPETAALILPTLASGAAGLLVGAISNHLVPGLNRTAAMALGSLGGLVAGSAGLTLYSAGEMILVGAVGALITFLLARFFVWQRLAGARGALPALLGAGVWGTLAVALLATPPDTSWLVQLWRQLLGAGAIAAWTLLTSLLLFLFLEGFLPLFRAKQTPLAVVQPALTVAVANGPVEASTAPVAEPTVIPASPPEPPAAEVGEYPLPTIGRLTLSADMLIVRTANEATRRMFTYPDNTLVGETANFFLRAHEQGDSLAQLAFVLETAARNRQTVHMIGIRSDGRRFNLSVTVAAVVEDHSPIYRLTLKPSPLTVHATYAP